ncbi:MAG: SPOR domain-containing protein [Gammaproteobacteria bacterium]|nr:SPOR domain-containing protein [Gammaproteobacteria bacterium]
MEQRLKERLVGATVLVVAGVIIIPFVLDGPKRARQSESVKVELPPQREDDGMRTVEFSLDETKSVKTPVAENTTTISEPVKPKTVTSAEPEPNTPTTTAPPETVTPREESTAPPESGWSVQVGSFSRESNALTLQADLKKQGFDAFVSRYTDSRGVHFRVRVGIEPTRDEARILADRIQRETDLPAKPVPHP